MPASKSGLQGTPRFRASRYLLSLCLTISGLQSFQVSAEAQAQTQAAVLAVVTDLFDAMREKNAADLESLFLPQARLGDKAVTGWIEQLSRSSAYLDEVTYDETIMIDGDLAMAWTPYTIYVDGTLHHCGVDVFVMKRIEGQWKISQLDDTRRQENCPDPNG
ncbi:MAG: nuclear transport factor 2 family protein [Congregibacter sp.]